jgi:hypothetical protein
MQRKSYRLLLALLGAVAVLTVLVRDRAAATSPAWLGDFGSPTERPTAHPPEEWRFA